jgi:hypothetical protein
LTSAWHSTLSLSDCGIKGFDPPTELGCLVVADAFVVADGHGGEPRDR